MSDEEICEDFKRQNNQLVFPRGAFHCQTSYPQLFFSNSILESNNKDVNIQKHGKVGFDFFSKTDYDSTVQLERNKFVFDNFSDILNKLFEKLREDAKKMRPCHHEVSFVCPDHFNVDRTEEILRKYFEGIGYETVASIREDETSVISLTLT